ncbi:hypothetical protein J1614_008695 [Plenodomus biglobosus]|nr:hypothetical protein J1614_008695 [Plenodomus biglobosus]
MFHVSRWFLKRLYEDTNGSDRGLERAHCVGRCRGVVTAAACMACREATRSALEGSKAAIAGPRGKRCGRLEIVQDVHTGCGAQVAVMPCGLGPSTAAGWQRRVSDWMRDAGLSVFECQMAAPGALEG